MDLDPRARCLAALKLLSREYAIGAEFEQLQRANNWQAGAIAMLAEAVAALTIEMDARAACSGGQNGRANRKSRPA